MRPSFPSSLYLYGSLGLASIVAAIAPAAVYDGGYTSPDAQIQLRIGNGGAGQSGLVGGEFSDIPLSNAPRIYHLIMNSQ
jgi:hypothetical protein